MGGVRSNYQIVLLCLLAERNLVLIHKQRCYIFSDRWPTIQLVVEEHNYTRHCILVDTEY